MGLTGSAKRKGGSIRAVTGVRQLLLPTHKNRQRILAIKRQTSTYDRCSELTILWPKLTLLPNVELRRVIHLQFLLYR